MNTIPAALIGRLRAIAAARAAGAVAADEAAIEREFAAATRLAVYGTLAPGGSNHREVAHLGGTWQPGSVRGRRQERAYPVFTWDEDAEPVPVMVLETPSLRAHWGALDAFEGPDYRRILVPVRRGDGTLAVANLYSATLPVAPSMGHSD